MIVRILQSHIHNSQNNSLLRYSLASRMHINQRRYVQIQEMEASENSQR